MRYYKAEVAVVWREIFWRLRMVEEEVWKFPKISSKKQRIWYTPDSVSHPAKMNTLLTRKLINTFTKQGDVVLDPMAGIGTTLVEAMLLGRNVVGVDIEEKFCKLMEGNLENVKQLNDKSRFKLRLGRAAVVKGDSRQLAQLLQDKMDAVVTSPPYSGAISRHAGGDKVREQFEGFIGESQIEARKYSEDEANIGNLSEHGKVDAVVTSPPFGSTTIAKKFKSPEELEEFAKKQYVFKHGRSLEATKRFIKKSWGGYPENPENIANLKHGQVDTVITSPPFAEDHHGGGICRRIAEGKPTEADLRGALRGGFIRCRQGPISSNPENIDNIRKYGKSVDAIVTSPPYGDGKKGEVSPERKAKDFEEHYVPEMGGKSFHTQQRLRGVKSLVSGYSDDPKNIGNLKLGEVDAVITSPPYADIHQCPSNSAEWTAYFQRMLREKGYIEWEGKRYTEAEWRRMNHGRIDGRTTKGLKKDAHYSDNPENIGNLPHEKDVDVVITSPPYEATFNAKQHTLSGIAKRDPNFRREVGGYGQEDANIGNLRRGDEGVDAVITSPPYEKQLHDSREKRESGAWNGSELDVKKNLPMGYSENKNNIGNMQKETYLEAMLKVYMEMFKVLKPGGLAIIVLKNFIRNWKVVDLIGDTVKLCEHVGFRLVKLIRFVLPTESFWRTNYRIQYEKKFKKSFPEEEFASVYRFETVLVFEKSLSTFEVV